MKIISSNRDNSFIGFIPCFKQLSIFSDISCLFSLHLSRGILKYNLMFVLILLRLHSFIIGDIINNAFKSEWKITKHRRTVF